MGTIKKTFGKEEDDAENDFDCHLQDMSANVQRCPEGREGMMSSRKRTVLGVLLATAAAIICAAIDEFLKDSGSEAYPLAESKPPMDFGEEE